MKIAITGHSGFVGTNLKRYLTALGHEVEPLNGESREWRTYHNARDCDALVHLAGKNRVKDPWSLLDHNILSTYEAARFCGTFGKPLVFTSSTYPHKSHYKASKAASEQIMQSLADNDLLDFTALKLPKIIGPGCKPHYNSFVSTVLYSIAKEEPYEHLIQDKTQMLELIHVDDVCSIIEDTILTWTTPEAAVANVVTIAPRLILSLEEIIQAATGEENNEFKRIVEWYRSHDV
jgi:UDP-2-acetamido-2,6-beta-L-arabino-hexul-4-ose reductase